MLPSLLAEFAGKVNLIYIDPPFDTGADFSFTATMPDDPETRRRSSAEFTKEPSIIEQKAYRDTWGRDLDSYAKVDISKPPPAYANSCMRTALFSCISTGMWGTMPRSSLMRSWDVTISSTR